MNHKNIQNIQNRFSLLKEMIEVLNKSEKKFFSHFTGSVRRSAIAAGESAVALLDAMEACPIFFAIEDAHWSRDASALQQTQQLLPFQTALEYSKRLEELLSHYNSNRAQEVYQRLHHRAVALRYRLETANGGWDSIAKSHDDEEEFTEILKYNSEKIASAAHLWKKKEKILTEKYLSDKEAEKLLQAARYPAFVSMLMNNKNQIDPTKDITNLFFTWVLRDKNNPLLFILFPRLQEKLQECNMSGRLGRIGSSHLKIFKEMIPGEKIAQKIVTLPFEGKDVNILDDEAHVSLRGNWHPTVGEVFAIFKNKFRACGDVEFLADGITNWNSYLWGWWDAENEEHHEIDLLQKEWWKLLPLFEVISLEEAQKRYGPHLNGTLWNAAATSTRGTTTLNYDSSHSYLELAIPLGGGSYGIYDFGKVAKKFSTTVLEQLQLVCQNLYATIAYPDENAFYTHRQHAYHSFPMTPAEGLALMERIRRDMVLGRAENFVYQIETDNCAKWLHDHIEAILEKEEVPNLYRTPLLKAEPTGLVALLFRFIRMLPILWQIPVLMAFHLPFGAAQPTWIIEQGQSVGKSMQSHAFWSKGEVYLPALLHRKQEQGFLLLLEDSALCYASVAQRLLGPSWHTIRHAIINFLRALKENNFPAYTKLKLPWDVYIGFLQKKICAIREKIVPRETGQMTHSHYCPHIGARTIWPLHCVTF